MKKFTYILISLLVTATGAFAQAEMDALRFSREDIFGTARSMSMGGAFGALGGDQSGVTINPAGIAIYRRSEVVATMGFSGERSTVGNRSISRNSFDMDNLGFVGYFPLRNDAVPFINFGFTYNRTKSFNKRVRGVGAPGSSLLNYIASGSSGWHEDDLAFRYGANNQVTFDPFTGEAPWLSVLAYNNWLINPNGDRDNTWSPVAGNNELVGNEINMREQGYINNYSMTFGTTINNVLSIGAALSIKEISYSLTSEYYEDFRRNENWFRLENMLTTDGAGVGARLGLIYRPVHQLRLGVAYHTPTWYALSETFSAAMEDEMAAYITAPEYKPGRTFSAVFRNDYNLRTPGKWTLSMAGVLGNRFIASLDYELVDYRRMQLALPSNSNLNNRDWYAEENKFIEMDFRPASTVRLGLEYRFLPQLSGRLGYAWMQNPYDATFARNANPSIAGSNTIFRIEGDTNYFTGGFGYRFNQNFSLDVALMYKTQTDDLYAFPRIVDDAGRVTVDSTPFELKNTSWRGMVTLGYRF